MESKEIIKFLKEFEEGLKPVTPVALSPEQLVERKAAKLKIEQAKQKECTRIEKLKGKRILRGVDASPGLAVGIVRNIHTQVPELMAQIEPGDVIVADRLTVEDDVLISRAAALVMNKGGRNCSASITAKARGKPAVTGTMGEGEEATQILKTGQRVVVDGTEGVVYECIKTKSAKSRKG